MSVPGQSRPDGHVRLWRHPRERHSSGSGVTVSPQLLAVTSADRLHAGWTAARRIRRDNRGSKYAGHIERLLTPLPRDCGIVIVLDGHPATLGCSARCAATAMEALGVDHFGQTGTIGDLYRHYGTDANAIIDAAEGFTVGAPARHRKIAV
jgi:pyruvate dehydrogenase E1 component